MRARTKRKDTVTPVVSSKSLPASGTSSVGKKIFMDNTDDEEVEEVNELSVFPPKFMISFAKDRYVGDSTLPQYILERN